MLRPNRFPLLLAGVLLLTATGPATDARTPVEIVQNELREEVRAAVERTHAVTAPSGHVSAKTHECVPLTIDCNDAGFGEITPFDCVTDSGVYFDIIFFSGIAGQTITADLSSFDFDPFLLLFDPDANLHADDDDSGPGLDARIIHVLDQTSDSWSLVASPLQVAALGDYLLSLACSAAPNNAPATPSNLTATAQSSTQVRLTWNDNSSNETSFRIEMRASGGFTELGSVSANSTSATVTDLNPGSTVDFRVRARNSDGNSGYSNVATVTLPQSGGGAPCANDATTLCLNGRFRVEVNFDTTQGGGSSGSADAIALDPVGVDRGGMFTFFNASNPELLVKVLDGCPVNGNFWVFYAATTNVGFQITVTDTLNGTVWTRTNPDGNPAAPVQDTGAFATCP